MQYGRACTANVSDTKFLHTTQNAKLPLPRFLCTSKSGAVVQKSLLLTAIQKEIQRHDFSYFVDEPPSVAQGGKGVVVSGCPACRKRINTMTQFLDHLTNDAMPELIDRLAAGNGESYAAKSDTQPKR